MIPALVFLVFIVLGNTLDLAVSLIAFSYFDRLVAIFSQAPDVVSRYNELHVALLRI